MSHTHNSNASKEDKVSAENWLFREISDLSNERLSKMKIADLKKILTQCLASNRDKLSDIELSDHFNYKTFIEKSEYIAAIIKFKSIHGLVAQSNNMSFSVGEQIKCIDTRYKKNKKYDAMIKRVEHDQVFVSYKGYSDSYSQWIYKLEWNYRISKIQPKYIDNKGGFNLNIYGQNKYWEMPERITKDISVKRVKQLFKRKFGIKFELHQIALYANSEILPSNKTLGEVGITNNHHEIIVRFLVPFYVGIKVHTSTGYSSLFKVGPVNKNTTTQQLQDLFEHQYGLNKSKPYESILMMNSRKMPLKKTLRQLGVKDNCSTITAKIVFKKNISGNSGYDDEKKMISESKNDDEFSWEIFCGEVYKIVEKGIQSKSKQIRSRNIQLAHIEDELTHGTKIIQSKVMPILRTQKRKYKINMSKLERMNLFSECKRVLNENLFNGQILLNDLSLPLEPICICGAGLRPKKCGDCSDYYKKYGAICDSCDKKINQEKDIFHCIQKSHKHKDGWDICIQCSRTYGTTFKRYHALIVNAFDAKRKITDGQKLKDLFANSLQYQEVVLLDGNDATHQNIKQELSKLSVKNENDVILICYSGHGAYDNSRSQFSFDLRETDRRQPRITSTEFMKYLNLSGDAESNRNAALDGISCDVIIIINACHSGGFSIENPNPRNNDTSEEKSVNQQDTEKQRLMADFKESDKWNESARTITVLSSCNKNAESIADPYGISPFVEYVIDAFENNNHDVITPQTVFEDVKQRSQNAINQQLGMSLHQLGQNPEEGYHGKYASMIPLRAFTKKQ